MSHEPSLRESVLGPKTYIGCNVELLEQRLICYFLIAPKQILIEHLFDLFVSRPVQLFVEVARLAERFEDLERGAFRAA